MSNGRVCVVFKPAIGKHAGDISRNLPAIEKVIKGAGGSTFAVYPHDNAALFFSMPGGTGPQTAESVVNTLNKLTDQDGKTLLEAEQGVLGVSATKGRFDPENAILQFS